MSQKSKIAFYISIAFSLIAYTAIAHFIVPHHVYQLIATYLLAFAAYGVFLNNKIEFKLWQLFALGFLSRVVMFNEPSLSDDFYRYYWDSKLLIEGINPYSKIPNEVLNATVNSIEINNNSLFERLNSKEYYSVYPPFLQYVFAVAALIGKSLKGFVIVLSIFSILAELGIFFILKGLLKIFKRPTKSLAIYWLNPLIIIELSGNLHPELYMLLALLCAVYLHKLNKQLWVGVLLAIAILTKLYPILFVPLFLIPFKAKDALKMTLGLSVSLVALSLPLLNSESIFNMFESVQLYYNKFEFNGSIYHLMKQAGYKLTGYNQIALVGKILAGLTIVSFLAIYYLRFRAPSKFNIFKCIYLGMIAFYLLSTTIMPWYLSLIILAAVFNNSKVCIVWSALIILTYSAFANINFNEEPALVAVEYYALAAVIFFELRNYFRQRVFEPY